MPVNFPGPYQLRFYYDCEPGAEPSLPHVLQVNVDLTEEPDPGTPFTEIDCLRFGGLFIGLHNVVDNFVAVLLPLLSAADTALNYVELWKYEPLTFNASYISTYAIAEPGTSISAGSPAEQETYSFRTREGGIMKIVLLEQLHGNRHPENYSDLSQEEKDMVDWVVGPTTTHFLGRDTSYPFVFHKLSAGTNEHTFERRFRR